MDLLLPKPLRVTAVLLILGSIPAHAEPVRVSDATKQLILVTPAKLDAPSARMRLYERADAKAEWTQAGPTSPVVGGVKGFAWGWDQKPTPQEQKAPSRKVEGDNRTPMGVFPIGHAFGFAAAQRPDYLHLTAGKTFCVDDVASPQYGRIVARARLPKGTSGEDMATIPFYRSGFLVDFPPNAERRGGSCIFLHLWREPNSGTAGCVAMDAPAMKALHDWVKPGAVIAILPGDPSEMIAMLR